MPNNDDPPEASLLGAPAEIRNRIYELVLGTYQILTVKRGHGKEPALLRACRQIRSEGSDIFFHNNEFELTIESFKLAPQPQHWYWTKVPERRATTMSKGECVWENYLEWLERYHAGIGHEFEKGMGCRLDEGLHDVVLTPCLRAFELVKLLHDQPWWKVKAALEIFRDGVNDTKTSYDDVGQDGVFI